MAFPPLHEKGERADTASNNWDSLRILKWHLALSTKDQHPEPGLLFSSFLFLPGLDLKYPVSSDTLEGFPSVLCGGRREEKRGATKMKEA